ARKFKERTGMEFDLSLDEDVKIDEDRSTTLFRILQETLTNTTRHAHATRVKVCMQKEDSQVVLEVNDNGMGITTEQISDHSSLGLIGMRERVLFWNGEVNISGIQGRGTTVRVTIPLDKR
ncbi:MAG: ATP-binding protein, partial [Thermodesulfobacteriota bacterium]